MCARGTGSARGRGEGGRCSLRCRRRAPRALRSRPRRAAVRWLLRSVGLKGTGGLGEPHRGVRVPRFALGSRHVAALRGWEQRVPIAGRVMRSLWARGLRFWGNPRSSEGSGSVVGATLTPLLMPALLARRLKASLHAAFTSSKNPVLVCIIASSFLTQLVGDTAVFVQWKNIFCG